MAHKKAGGTAKNLRDSQPKFLGIKIPDGGSTNAGAIIVRQRGTKILPGANVRVGKDHTIYAAIAGTVKYTTRRKMNFDGTQKRLGVASVVPAKK